MRRSIKGPAHFLSRDPFPDKSLDYNSANNGFIAGSAPDVAGLPGAWSFSAEETRVPDTNVNDGWLVGMAYSAHNSMSLGNPEVQGEPKVSFDNFKITTVPEPSSSLLGLLAVRRKR